MKQKYIDVAVCQEDIEEIIEVLRNAPMEKVNARAFSYSLQFFKEVADRGDSWREIEIWPEEEVHDR